MDEENRARPYCQHDCCKGSLAVVASLKDRSVEQNQLDTPILLATFLGVVARRRDRVPKARRREPILGDVVLRNQEHYHGGCPCGSG